MEDEAAPAMGSAPSTSGDPNSTTNKYHISALQSQLGIGDDEMMSTLEGEPVQVWQVPDYSSKWGFMVQGPCTGILKHRPDGSFDITYQLAQKKLMEPKAFIRPYRQGERPISFDGPVTDQTETITPEELNDIIATPFKSGGVPAGGGMGGMGGMDGGMGGGMGAPPPGMGAGGVEGGPPGGAPTGGI